MSEYNVMFEVFASTSVTVQADSVEQAKALAEIEASTSLCHNCSRSLNVSDVGEVLEVLGPDNEVAWSRPEDNRVAELEAELAEAVDILTKLMDGVVWEDPHISVNNAAAFAFLAR
ncbi:hypothetical protein SAMN05216409_1511, partial [Pseudomonas lutea]